MSDRCEWPHCRDDYDVIYAGKKICDYHWTDFLGSENATKAAKARIKLGLPKELPTAEWAPPNVDPASVVVCRSADDPGVKAKAAVPNDEDGEYEDTDSDDSGDSEDGEYEDADSNDSEDGEYEDADSNDSEDDADDWSDEEPATATSAADILSKIRNREVAAFDFDEDPE